MYNVSADFITAVQSQNREISLEVKFNSSVVLTGDNLISINFKEAFGSGELKMGETCSSEVEISFRMPSTPIPLDNGWVEPKVGFKVGSAVEYVPLGKFYITDFKSKDNYKTVTITAFDGFMKMEGSYDSQLSFPASVSSVASEIATKCGITIEPTAYPDIEIPYIEATYREMIGYIAGLMGKNARFNRDGKLEFKWYASTNRTIDSSIQYQGGFERKDRTVFTISSVSAGTEGNVYTAGSGRGISFTNPFITQAIVNSIHESVSGGQFVPSTTKWRGNPAIETGDVVTVEGLDGGMHSVYIMEQTLKISGGMSAEIVCHGLSDAAIVMGKSPTDKKIAKAYADLEKAFQNATEVITGAKGGYYNLILDEITGLPSGWTIRSTPAVTSTTKMWIFNNGGLGFSSNGGATISKIALTSDGQIAADAITTGILKVKNDTSWLDMENGTFSLANGKIVFDGSSLNIKLSDGASLESKISAMNGQIALKVGSTELTNAIDNIKIGGRNLVLNSKDIVADNLGSDLGSRKEYVALNLGQSYMDIPNDTQVTISFDIEMVVNTANPSLQIYNTNNKGLKTITGTSKLFTAVVGSTIKERVHTVTRILDRTDANKTDNYIELYSVYGTNNFFKITNLKVETGNKATDYSPAPEDTDETIDTINRNLSTTVETHTAEIEMLNNAINTTISDTYISKGDFNAFKQSNTLEIQQTATAINNKFTEAKSAIDDVGNNLAEFKALVETNILMDANGVTIGKSDSKFKTNMNNEAFSILENGEVAAQFNNKTLTVGNVQVSETVAIGGFAWELQPNGSLSLVYKG